MRNLLLTLVALILFSSCTIVEPGYKAVRVNLNGDSKGEAEVLPAGRYNALNWNVYYYHFPTFEQNYVFTSDKREGSPDDESFTFESANGAEITLNAGISYTVTDVKTAFFRYRKSIDEITDKFLRNMVRDGFNRYGAQYTVDSLYKKGKVQLVNQVYNHVKEETKEVGIEFHRLYLIGKPNYPNSVEKAINNKLKATQKATQKELERREAAARAEIARELAEGHADSVVIVAEGQAEANRAISRSLSPLLINYEGVGRWNGELPRVSSDAVPFINLK